MERPLHFLWRRLGRTYLRLVIAAQLQSSFVVTMGGVGLLLIYQEMTPAQFGIITAVALGLQAIETVLSYRVLSGLLRPADAWVRGERTPDTARSAWRALAGLPLAYVSHRRLMPVALNVAPISLFITLYLQLPWYAGFILAAGAVVVLTYGVFLRFFALELIVRPVLRDVSAGVPDGVRLGVRSIPLRWRMLAALPAINVVTGVVASGLSSTGRSELTDLGLDVAVAVVIAFTLSFELTVLLAKSILRPIADLREATERVAAGDLSTRVPVVSADETGALAGAFNAMVTGLQEREKLREAFGSYVSPELADRVMAEGTQLGGEEAEVSVLFLDIRDFTAFAERASATEVVAQLNEFFEFVVPILVEHGGHANKFVGDGLLGVFGAPDRRADHADRAVGAALAIAARVRRAYGERLRIGIGVNSGPVVAGTVGGGGRLEFTVIGDAVNTAARVEQETRRTGDTILLTEATRCLLTREHAPLRTRGAVALKGKRDAVALYALQDGDAPEPVLPARARADAPRAG